MGQQFLKKRLMIWGMGNPLHGDDGAGVRAAELLQERLRGQEGYEVRICETQPENFLGLLRRHPPERLLICDASDMGLPSGEPPALYPPGDDPGKLVHPRIPPGAPSGAFFSTPFPWSAWVFSRNPPNWDWNSPPE